MYQLLVNRSSNKNATRYYNVDKTISLTVKNAKLWIKLTMLGAGTVAILRKQGKKLTKYISIRSPRLNVL